MQIKIAYPYAHKNFTIIFSRKNGRKREEIQSEIF